MEINGHELTLKLSQAVNDAGGMKKFADAHGISCAIVSLTLSRTRPPNAAIANALGYTARMIFTPIRNASDAR